MNLLGLLFFFDVGGQCVQIAEPGSNYPQPPGVVATAEVYGAAAEPLLQRMDQLTYSNGIVFVAGAPVDPGDSPGRIEATELVLVSHTNRYGIGIAITDEGDLVTYVEHQSPRPPRDVVVARVRDAVQARKQVHRDLRGLLGAAGTNKTLIAASAPAPGANTTAVRTSLIQLQKTVAELQRQNEALTKSLLKSMNGKAE